VCTIYGTHLAVIRAEGFRWLVTALCGLAAQAAWSSSGDAVVPRVDERIELTSIVSRLAGYEEYTNDQFKSYAQDVDRYFGRFKNHPVIAFAKKVRETAGVSFDAVPSLAIHLSQPPELRPVANLETSKLDTRWTKDSAEKYAALLRQFYVDTDCRRFFTEHAKMYAEAERRFRSTLEKVYMPWYREFYGEQPKGHFHLVIGLLNGGGNYGPHLVNADKTEDLYAIMATYRMDKSGSPLYTTDDLPTIVHEYNHSFVNRLIEDNAQLFSKSGAEIFNQTSSQMRQQAYGDGKTVIIESLVRACVVRYLTKHPIDGMNALAQTGEEQARGFLWTQKLADLLGEYENDRRHYPTLRSFIPRIGQFFESVPAQIPEMNRAVEAKRPKVLSVDPVSNGASGVDAGIQEIRITFDRPMQARSGYFGVDARSPLVGKLLAAPDGRSFVGKAKLEEGHEYGFGLFGGVFRSSDGYSLGRDFVCRFSTKGYANPAPDPHYGYRLTDGQVEFVFEKPDYLEEDIHSVSVAGDFNNWDPSANGFELTRAADGKYVLKLNAAQIGKPGEKRQFKFVVNSGTWIAPARYAQNVEIDAQGHRNLFLIVE